MTIKRKIFFRWMPSLLVSALVIYSIVNTLFISDFGNNINISETVKHSAVSGFLSKYMVTTKADVKNIITILRNGDFTTFNSMLDPKIFDPTFAFKFTQQFNAIFPFNDPHQIKFTSFEVDKKYGKQGQVIYAVLHMHYPRQNFLFSVVLYKHQNRIAIKGIRVSPVYYSLDEIRKRHHVSLSNLSLKRMIVLSCAIFIPLIILLALVICINSDDCKRKWLWIVFVILGFVVFRFNWTDQTFYITPVGFNVFGAGWVRDSSYAPLFLNFSIPIGALVFLVKKTAKSLRSA